MDAQTLTMVKAAHTQLVEKNQKVEELQRDLDANLNKLASYQRKELAEEIVLMKVASGSVSFEDVQEFRDEVDELAASDQDLDHLKTAMVYAGPRSVEYRLVDEDTDTEKTASTASVGDEPDHIRAAREQLNKSLETGFSGSDTSGYDEL